MEDMDLIKTVKDREKTLINHIENVVKNNHLEDLFKKYKETITNINKCYSQNELTFEESKQCAQKSMDKYLLQQKNFEYLLNYYQSSIIKCARLCKFDLKSPILPCYLNCFDFFIEKIE